MQTADPQALQFAMTLHDPSSRFARLAHFEGAAVHLLVAQGHGGRRKIDRTMGAPRGHPRTRRTRLDQFAAAVPTPFTTARFGGSERHTHLSALPLAHPNEVAGAPTGDRG